MNSRRWTNDVAYLAVGRTVSGFGTQLTRVALAVMVYQMAHTSLALGLSLILTTLPSLLLGSVAGTLTDRYDKQQAAVLFNGLLAMLTLVYMATSNLTVIYLVSLGMAVVATGLSPLEYVLIPTLTPRAELVRVNATMETLRNVVLVVGPLAAGALVGFAGVRIAFVVDAISYVFAALIYLVIRLPRAEPQPGAGEPGRFWPGVTEGLRYVLVNPALRFYLLFGVLMLTLAMMRAPLTYPYVKTVLGKGATEFGWLSAVGGAGGLLGGVAFGLLGKRIGNLGAWYLGLILTDGLVFVLLGINHTTWLALPLIFLSDALMVMENIIMGSAL